MKKYTPKWAWDYCPGCNEPMRCAPGAHLRFEITDDSMEADALLLAGWQCGDYVFGRVIRIKLKGVWNDADLTLPDGFSYSTKLTGRTVKCVS